MAFDSAYPFRPAVGAMLAILLIASGCKESTPRAADSSKARSGLQSALDGWKNGETSESLRSRTPPIYFNDPSCTSSNRLLAYEIESDEQSGFSWRFVVSLTTQSGDGKPRQRRVKYLIDTDPALVIVQDP